MLEGDSRVLAALLVSSVPSDVSIDVRPIRDDRAGLARAEAQAVARAVPHRQIEFSTGRAAARAALAALGHSDAVVLVGSSREPLWPHGFVGSLSHDAGLCIAMVARDRDLSALGTDLTSPEPLDPSVRTMICSRTEIERCRRPFPVDPGKVVFSAKEALYKAIFPHVRRFIDFREVEVQIDFDASAWGVSSSVPDLHGICRRMRGTLVFTDRHVVTTAWGADP